VPIDRQAKRFLDMLAAGGQSAAYQLVAQRRQALDDLIAWVGGDAPAVGDVRNAEVQGPGGPIGVRIYTPIGAQPGALGAMIFFHGGGWVAGSLETHDGVCRRLSNASGFRVIAVDYRLAPEHPFPAAVEDACAAVKAIAERADDFGVDAAQLGVAGDSAGAGLAAVVCQMARDNGPRIAFQLLICPILDVATESVSRTELAEGYFLNRATLERDLELYAPPDRADPGVSPLRASDLGGLPLAFIHIAEFDPFRDEGHAYAVRLAEAGVQVSDIRHEGMIHFFYAIPSMIGYAEEALRLMGAGVAGDLAANP